MDLHKKYESGYDVVVTGGILLLIIFTPLAFGAVHPWACMVMEAVIFLLTTMWMLKLIKMRSSTFLFPSSLRAVGSFTLPLVFFIGFAVFQLTPLPPTWVRVLSPATYDLYVHSLSGWPERLPYEDWF